MQIALVSAGSSFHWGDDTVFDRQSSTMTVFDNLKTMIDAKEMKLSLLPA
jgi:hypothetical protein